MQEMSFEKNVFDAEKIPKRTVVAKELSVAKSALWRGFRREVNRVQYLFKPRDNRANDMS